MKVLIELDELNSIRSAAIDNDDHTGKLCAINAELTAQLKEANACIARLKDKLTLHESSLEFIDGLVKEQAERIRRMMAGEDAKPQDDGWVKWGGGTQPMEDGVEIEVKYRRGATSRGISNHYRWRWLGSDNDIIAYRIVKEETKDSWIAWDGGEPPVQANKRVDVKYADGSEQTLTAVWVEWEQDTSIVAYRIAK